MIGNKTVSTAKLNNRIRRFLSDSEQFHRNLELCESQGFDGSQWLRATERSLAGHAAYIGLTAAELGEFVAQWVEAGKDEVSVK